MARKLLNEKGYSPNNVKVLLGGWSLWKEKNAQDPNGYPITVLATPVPGITDNQAPIVITNTGGGTPIVINPQPQP